MKIRFQRKDRNKQLMAKQNSKWENKQRDKFLKEQLKKKKANNILEGSD
ncbi:hypothetical protein [Bacillus phage KonjoTrouble]|uniref:Uncharacterized protein n=2 Tax=Claudivirus konjotrouble TaxID=2843774 RepID=A0A514AAN9_9CAUD|nr:hypothetical protein H3013_gp23 [Bacillus phage KonjoTrouble]ASU04146.1 hypothetical protein [Bacillus phage KonjoTrouble]QDH50305.1 hypothetical protein VIOLETTEMAD_24 [Bacillus phage VioletteMad]